MKFVVIACLASMAVAAPQFGDRRRFGQQQQQFGQQFVTQPQTQTFVQQPQPQQTFVQQPQQTFVQQPQQTFVQQPRQQTFVQSTSPVIRQNQVAILRDDRQDLGNGEFSYAFEAENGISETRRGYTGFGGQTNMEGSYRFPLPDGTFAEVRFVADENGFRAESPLIPTPPPLPAHAIEQIRFAEEQRARGITFNDY